MWSPPNFSRYAPARTNATIASPTTPAAGVVVEAMLAYVLADAYRRKFGGDHIDDVREAVERYRERIAWRG